VKFSPDGTMFAVGSHDNVIYLYDARGGRYVGQGQPLPPGPGGLSCWRTLLLVPRSRPSSCLAFDLGPPLSTNTAVHTGDLPPPPPLGAHQRLLCTHVRMHPCTPCLSPTRPLGSGTPAHRAFHPPAPWVQVLPARPLHRPPVVHHPLRLLQGQRQHPVQLRRVRAAVLQRPHGGPDPSSLCPSRHGVGHVYLCPGLACARCVPRSSAVHPCVRPFGFHCGPHHDTSAVCSRNAPVPRMPLLPAQVSGPRRQTALT
jgi:hypothetical protein